MYQSPQHNSSENILQQGATSFSFAPTSSFPPASVKSGQDPSGHLQESQTVVNHNINETRLKDAVTKIYGVDVTTVPVEYNSDKPAQYGAEAIALSNKVYLAPSKKNRLAHELCHIAQQQLGLVQPTRYLGETPFNDDPILEREADVRGAQAIAMAAEAAPPGIVRCLQGEGDEPQKKRVRLTKSEEAPLFHGGVSLTPTLVADSNPGSKVIQAKFGMEYEFTKNKCMAKDRKDVL